METVIRAVRWPDDIPALCALDTAFTTDRVYRLEQGEFGFALVEEGATPPLTKVVCTVGEEIADLRQMEHVAVAEADGKIVGMAAAKHSRWNGRVELWHLYVQPSHRGDGAGTALVESVLSYARTVGARCVWLETQNVNYPAVQFYRRRGFRLAGFDRCLYDPKAVGRDEVALFFAREV